jgi:hypothetical protein
VYKDQLVEAIKQVCVEQNVLQMLVLTSSKNQAALSLYTKTGGVPDVNGDCRLLDFHITQGSCTQEELTQQIQVLQNYA